MKVALKNATIPKFGEEVIWSGINGSCRSLAIAQILSGNNSCCLIITNSNDESIAVINELNFFIRDNIDVLHLPDVETLPYDTEPPHAEVISVRAEILSRLSRINERQFILVTSIHSALRLLPNQSHWSDHIQIHVGDQFNKIKVIEKLLDLGYRQTEAVNSRGEFCFNNEIFDIVPYGGSHSCRLTVNNEKISSIKKLSLSTQLSSKNIESISLLTSREFSFDFSARQRFVSTWKEYFGPESTRDDIYRSVRDGKLISGLESYHPFFNQSISLFDLLPKDCKVIQCQGVNKTARDYEASIDARFSEVTNFRTINTVKPEDLWLSFSRLKEAAKEMGSIVLCNSSESASINIGSKETYFERKESVDSAIEMLEPWIEKVKNVIYCMSSDARREEMDFICDMLDQSPEWITDWSQLSESKATSAIALASIEKGFYLPDSSLLVITEREIFGQPIFQKVEIEDSANIEFNRYKDLQTVKVGDPLVHLKYGVGRFNGLVSLDYFGIKREFLTIKYADDGILYVKMEELDYVSRYSGINKEKAPLDSVGSEKWVRGLKSSFTDIKSTAQNLMRIHAEKEVKIGISMGETDHRYEKFCAEFPFQETRDQLAATNDIINDLQSNRPMDRIVCGDVGFGKTEVAMRAAFHAVASGYQVALMVPSTILAHQHYESFKQRFSSFPFKIECMTRFASKTEEKATLKKLSTGEINILIGTHRIIQSDVKYRKLGLLIIDEEHRFGVKQKEKLREMRTDMNLLSMTATPIPRTLSMSMHGIRDLSTITTPPAKRLSIRTSVNRTSNNVIKEAISREILRSGQVFYVHNSIETIEDAADNIRCLFPNIKVAVAHAKMSETMLEDVMAKFYSRKYDVLVCTTIIETGIDVPNANTIIIEKANEFGLAQLHQLRGRVGRSTKQAYAYLCTSTTNLSPDAEKRLNAMVDANSLGEGFMLANHDLEIRGAGEILGEKQSGHIQAIGFQLYMRLLERAIEILKAGQSITGDFKDQLHVDVELSCSSLIPNDYISSQALRLSFYKRIASVEDQSSLDAIHDEIIDRFGPVPKLLKDHLNLAAVKFGLSKDGVIKVFADDNGGYIQFEPENFVAKSKYNLLAITKEDLFDLKNGDKLHFNLPTKSLEERIELIAELTK